MRCAARATEAIQYNAILLCSMLHEPRYEISMLGREKHTRSPDHCRALLFTIGKVGEPSSHQAPTLCGHHDQATRSCACRVNPHHRRKQTSIRFSDAGTLAWSLDEAACKSASSCVRDHGLKLPAWWLALMRHPPAKPRFWRFWLVPPFP